MPEAKRPFLWCAVAGLTFIVAAAVATGPAGNAAADDKNSALKPSTGAVKPSGPTKPAGVAVPTGAVVPSGVRAIRFEHLSSKAQFSALADDTLLEVEGRKIRKADFIAEFKRRSVFEPVGAGHLPDGLPAVRARFVAEEQAAIAASAAEVRRSLAGIEAKGAAR